MPKDHLGAVETDLQPRVDINSTFTSTQPGKTNTTVNMVRCWIVMRHVKDNALFPFCGEETVTGVIREYP